MAKDYQLAVCTRRRVVASILIAIFSFITLNVAGILVDDYYLKRLENERSLLKVGMTEQELLRIMGQPALYDTKVVAELTPRGFPPQSIPDEIREHHKRLVEYHFASKRILWSSSVYILGGVFLDENRKAIVLLTDPGFGILELYVSITDMLVSIMVMIIVVTVPVAGFLYWCKKRMRGGPVQNIYSISKPPKG